MKHLQEPLLYLMLFSAMWNAQSFVERQQQRQQCYSSSSSSSSSSRSTRRRSKYSNAEYRLYSSSTSSKKDVRFLGRGPNAIVRPGCVLLAPSEEYHHYLRQAAVFIYAMGTDDNDDYVVRGVILDNPTPFSMGEMMESKIYGGVYDNLIYRGGDTGGEDAFCLHSINNLGLEEIGTSNLYQGGDVKQLSDPSKVKFFFNYMEFLEQELEEMLEITHEDGDGWISVEVPPEMVLDTDYDKGDAWRYLRNAIRGM